MWCPAPWPWAAWCCPASEADDLFLRGFPVEVDDWDLRVCVDSAEDDLLRAGGRDAF